MRRTAKRQPTQFSTIQRTLAGAQREYEAGRLDEAKRLCLQILAIDERDAEASNLLGLAHYAAGYSEGAVEMIRRAIAVNGSTAHFHTNLGHILQMQGKLGEAVAEYKQAIDLKPNFAEALSNLGSALLGLGELEEAELRLERALALSPDLAEAHSNLGMVLQERGKPGSALAHYDQALALKPDFAEAEWNRSLIQLLQGNFAEGWRNYQWRYQRKKIAPRSFSQPLWRGEPLNGSRILLHAEQGLGDSLQFLRYLPMVQASGCTVLLDVPSSLRRLAEQLPGIAELTVSGQPLPPFDWHCPLMSLPLAFRTTLETIPAQVPYLSIPEAVQKAAGELSWPENGLRVGLVWSGSPQHHKDRVRSIPLSLLDPLFQLKGVHFFSLQMGPGAEQLATVQAAITDLSPAIGDLADTAALMAQLDLIITVDTSVAHLAGALAKPTWVLLPLAPDWRWLLGREDSPWYPTMRLFRQTSLGDWQSVITRVCAELAALAGSSRNALKPERPAEIGPEVRPKAVPLASNSVANLMLVADPHQVECKICAGPSLLFGTVDFHKSCIEAQGRRLPLSGYAIYYRRCQQCGFTFTTAFDAWNSKDFHENIYNRDYIIVDPDFSDLRPSRNANLVASSFHGSENSIKILDFGGGGQLAARLREQGFSAATCNPFSSLNQMPSDKFDLIACFDLMERVPFPQSTVASMVSLLKNPGAILFSTLVQPADFEAMGLNWWYASPRNGHISLYSVQSLARLFKQYGMRVGSFDANLHIAYAQIPPFAAHLNLPG